MSQNDLVLSHSEEIEVAQFPGLFGAQMRVSLLKQLVYLIPVSEALFV